MALAKRIGIGVLPVILALLFATALLLLVGASPFDAFRQLVEGYNYFSFIAPGKRQSGVLQVFHIVCQ